MDTYLRTPRPVKVGTSHAYDKEGCITLTLALLKYLGVGPGDGVEIKPSSQRQFQLRATSGGIEKRFRDTSMKPPRFEPYTLNWETYYAAPRKILYVGKATMGMFNPQEFPDWWGKKRSAFWNFARRVSELADSTAAPRLSNLVWSNLAKQGVFQGNPTWKNIERETPKPSDVLREEVRRFRPDIIVLVNANFHEPLTKEALQIGKEGEPGGLTQHPISIEGWSKLELWYREAWEKFPAIVWMWHPERKPALYTDEAFALIKTVTGWLEE